MLTLLVIDELCKLLPLLLEPLLCTELVMILAIYSTELFNGPVVAVELPKVVGTEILLTTTTLGSPARVMFEPLEKLFDFFSFLLAGPEGVEEELFPLESSSSSLKFADCVLSDAELLICLKEIKNKDTN